MTAIGNGAVTVRVMIKTKPGAQWAIGRAARAQIKGELDRAGIHVAMPILPQSGSGAAKQG